MIQVLRKEGWILNPIDKVVNSLFKAIERNDGNCPCSMILKTLSVHAVIIDYMTDAVVDYT